ncbi:MAG: TolC family protein [Atribacterota bacterium]|nr:TolC family protein [Atribacterota bacterium]
MKKIKLTVNYHRLLLNILFAGAFFFFSGILSLTLLAADASDISLDECIQIALENNLGYQITKSTVDIKDEQVKEAEGASKINAKFQAGYIRMNDAPDPESILEGDFSYLFSTGQSVPQISFNFSKVLYSGGKLKTIVEQADAVKNISLNELEQKKHEIIYQVTQAYYQVLQAEGMMKVTEQALTQIKAHLGNSEALLAEGMIAPIDLNRIKSQLSSLEHNLIQAENGLILAFYNLNAVMGIELLAVTSLKNNLTYYPCEITLEEALEKGKTIRPEIKNLTEQRVIMEGMVDIAKSNKKPQIVMNMQTGLSGWQIAVMGEVPILDGGINDAKIKQAELSLGQVDQGRKQIEQMIEFEIRSAYLKMKEAEKLIKITEQGIEDSAESFRIAQVKYNEGIATNAEVIDAQSALIEAETNHLNALYEYNINQAALIKAMGNADR